MLALSSVGKVRALSRAGILAAVLIAASVPAEPSEGTRQLTLAEAQALAARSSDGSEIPITVNEMVLAKLNEFLATPKSLQSIKDGLTRMPIYRPLIERKLSEYGEPSDLLAIPLLETRYRNDLVSDGDAKGLWQFMAATARRYHLVVNGDLDERLNPAKETEAAMQYFRDLNDMFQDWRLAIKAYNEGERHVQDLINQYGTRDPWVLEKIDSPEGYLSGAMAMILIFRNPSLAD